MQQNEARAVVTTISLGVDVSEADSDAPTAVMQSEPHPNCSARIVEAPKAEPGPATENVDGSTAKEVDATSLEHARLTIFCRLLDLILVRDSEPPNPPQAHLNHLDVIRIICVFAVVMCHWSTSVDYEGPVMNRLYVNGDAIVLPGLFFVSGSVFQEMSKRQIEKNRDKQGHVPLKQVLKAHWGGSPKVLLLAVVCLLVNVCGVALNQAFTTDQYCTELGATEHSCRKKWNLRWIFYHSWYLFAILLLQCVFFFYSASKAYARGSREWWVCYACQSVILSGILGYFAATDLLSAYDVQHTSTLVGYLLSYAIALGLTMVPFGSRIAFFVFIGGLWLSLYKHSILDVGVVDGALFCMQVVPGYFSGMLSREGDFLTGWPRKQFAAYMWYPMFIIIGFNAWVNPCLGDLSSYRKEEVPWQWVGQMYIIFVFYACGFEEMMRHVVISRAHSLSSIALYVFHPLVLDIAHLTTQSYWLGVKDGSETSAYWYMLLLPWAFHGITLTILRFVQGGQESS